MAVTWLLKTVFRRRKKKKSTEFVSNSAVFEFDFDTIKAATNEFSELVDPHRASQLSWEVCRNIVDDLKPKIVGFELARRMQQGDSEAESTVIVGTIRKAWSVDGDSLIEYVMRCWNRGEAIDVIHEAMREEEREDSISEILRYIHIALLCIDENAETRPSIDKVLHWFSCFSTPLPEPTFGNRFLAEEETNRLWSPSLSPGHSSVTSPISSR
ncbi:unnamed protein product [Arabidopsis arenosa]|uniref:Uncharacterized protein n=1 Tax=Arabidopsis arenosa TaxID=38785 RepID=A0A8S2AX95_ARAAE|nr:unnamed protein product [Arabidopsis arenosa]